jgi:hypothetical protein
MTVESVARYARRVQYVKPYSLNNSIGGRTVRVVFASIPAKGYSLFRAAATTHITGSDT